MHDVCACASTQDGWVAVTLEILARRQGRWMGIPAHVVECMLGIIGRLRQLRLSLDINSELLERMPGGSESRILMSTGC